MSISDLIVVMKEGVMQQMDRPQAVYDSPVNLFVAKFLGTPAINVFSGAVRNGRLFVGGDDVLPAPGVADREVYVGIRPEGFVLDADGPLACALSGVEVMGRDTSVLAAHPASLSGSIRAIISAENRVDTASPGVRFAVKPNKTFIFDRENEERLALAGE